SLESTPSPLAIACGTVRETPVQTQLLFDTPAPVPVKPGFDKCGGSRDDPNRVGSGRGTEASNQPLLLERGAGKGVVSA
ncbi:MAG: hypothetical protein ABIO94_10240, partial [Opitutaceae bacterium]